MRLKMSDAALNWYDFGADISIENGDLAADEGLATGVLISLFTDARAPSESLLPPGEKSLRGWWGDLDETEKTGSLLWLINREKTISEVATRAREYCEDCLSWIVEEQIAEKVIIETLIIKPQSLQIKILIERGAAKKYSYLWDGVKEYAGVTIQNTSIKLQFIE